MEENKVATGVGLAAEGAGRGCGSSRQVACLEAESVTAQLKGTEMTKHTDTSRSTDSGVSGNAQTSAREIR